MRTRSIEALLKVSLLISVFVTYEIVAEKSSPNAEAYLRQVRSSPAALRTFLRRMPKGAELHTHLSGTPGPDRLLQLAATAKTVKYFVSLPIKAEATEDPTAYAFSAYPTTTQQPPANPKLKYVTPDALLKSSEYKAHLAEFRQANLINSHDAKPLATFYATTFQRRGAVVNNREMLPLMLVDEIKQARRHRLSYLEMQLNPFPADPTLKSAENERAMNVTSAREFLQTLVDTVEQENKTAPAHQQVQVRFILAFLRTSPRILTQLPIAFEIASAKDSVGQAIAGINLVGNEYSEDLKAGQFIAGPENMRDYLLTLKRTYPRVHIALHAGEITAWDWHIRDSALSGAERIGHAV
ncbi:MAG: adenosine deaminase, partial [Spirochaetia bacterium]|nr:adenosine deaminase [Spirochaetia bacterium]